MPRIVDAAARRDAFVEVAADLIAAEGLEGASLRRVAAAAGCTTGAVTHYFGSREVLLAAVLRQAHDAAQARMEAAAMQVPDPMSRLRTVLHEALPLDALRRREWLVWLAFWAASTSDPILAEDNRTRYRIWRDRLLQLVTPLSDAPDETVDLLVAAVDGLGLDLILRGQGGTSADHAMARLEALLGRLLAAGL